MRTSETTESTQASTEEVLISAQNITKTYKVGRQKVQAVNGASLTIRKGEFVALIGASAYVVQQQFAPHLTAQAQFAFGGLDLGKEVNLIGVDQQQLLYILAACLLTGLLSMILPLLANVRRSPIKDMREE